MVAYEETVNIPRVVEKRVPVTYTCRVPRVVEMRVPISPCGTAAPACCGDAGVSYAAPAAAPLAPTGTYTPIPTSRQPTPADPPAGGGSQDRTPSKPRPIVSPSRRLERRRSRPGRSHGLERIVGSPRRGNATLSAKKAKALGSDGREGFFVFWPLQSALTGEATGLSCPAVRGPRRRRVRRDAEMLEQLPARCRSAVAAHADKPAGRSRDSGPSQTARPLRRHPARDGRPATPSRDKPRPVARTVPTRACSRRRALTPSALSFS